MITRVLSVMTHTNSARAFGGALVLVVLLTIAQSETRAREDFPDPQSSMHPDARRQGSSSTFAPNTTQPGTPEHKSLGKSLGQSPADMDLTREIRRAILNDGSLSPFAHNVMIIARDGQVTLKGPVRSAQEKQAVEEKAASVVGRENVKNDVEVSPGRQP